jgi:hypothetical protein
MCEQTRKLFGAEYGGGGRRDFMVVSKGGGKGWSGFVRKLRTIKKFQTSFSDDQKVPPSHSNESAPAVINYISHFPDPQFNKFPL